MHRPQQANWCDQRAALNAAPGLEHRARSPGSGFILATALGCLLAAGIPAAMADATMPHPATPTNPVPPAAVNNEPPPVEESLLVHEYRSAITALEQSSGAYSSGLSEQLLGLGTVLQQLNRHEEAIKAFKRGAHLARIESGLYSGQQLPLLRGEIRSHLALGDYTTVDNYQRYLYRVERQALEDGRETAQALMRHAAWQSDAYRLGVGEEDTRAGRLSLMWDLYRMALNELIKIDGSESPTLREPLLGMLQTQYLMSGYQSFELARASNAAEERPMPYTSNAFSRGEAILKGLLDLNIIHHASVEQHSQDLVALGDWAWWFGKREEARGYYSEAMAVIADAQEQAIESGSADRREEFDALHEDLFSLPTPLPDLQDMEPIPRPTWGDDGALVISFTVTDTGRVIDLERLAAPDVEEERPLNRLVRALRNTRFRPRFIEGTPVDTENVIWSWDAQDWRASPQVAQAR